MLVLQAKHTRVYSTTIAFLDDGRREDVSCGTFSVLLEYSEIDLRMYLGLHRILMCAQLASTR